MQSLCQELLSLCQHLSRLASPLHLSEIALITTHRPHLISIVTLLQSLEASPFESLPSQDSDETDMGETSAASLLWAAYSTFAKNRGEAWEGMKDLSSLMTQTQARVSPSRLCRICLLISHHPLLTHAHTLVPEAKAILEYCGAKASFQADHPSRSQALQLPPQPMVAQEGEAVLPVLSISLKAQGGLSELERAIMSHQHNKEANENGTTSSDSNTTEADLNGSTQGNGHGSGTDLLPPPSPSVMTASESSASLGGVVLVSPLDARRSLLTLAALFQSLNTHAATPTHIDKQLNQAGGVGNAVVSGAV